MKPGRTPVLAGIAFIAAVVCLGTIVVFYAYGEMQTARGSATDAALGVAAVGFVNLPLICIPAALFGLAAGIGIRRLTTLRFVAAVIAAVVAFSAVPAWTLFLYMLGLMLSPP